MLASTRRVEMVLAVKTIAHITQTDRTGHVLQFAVAVGRAGQAIERVIGDVQLHDIAPSRRKRVRLRANLHASLDGRRAGCRVAFAAFDFDETEAAGAERLQAVGCAEFRNVDAGLARGAQDAGPGLDRRGQSVDLDLDRFRAVAGGCSEV